MPKKKKEIIPVHSPLSENVSKALFEEESNKQHIENTARVYKAKLEPCEHNNNMLVTANAGGVYFIYQCRECSHRLLTEKRLEN